MQLLRFSAKWAIINVVWEMWRDHYTVNMPSSNQRWIQTFRHSQKNQSSQNKRLFSSNNCLVRHFVEHSVYKVQLVVKVTLKNLRANVLQNFANYELIIEFWSIFTLNMYFSNIYWQYLSLRNIQIVKLAKIKGFIWNSKFSLFFKTPSIYFYSFDKIISRLNPTLRGVLY